MHVTATTYCCGLLNATPSTDGYKRRWQTVKDTSLEAWVFADVGNSVQQIIPLCLYSQTRRLTVGALLKNTIQNLNYIVERVHSVHPAQDNQRKIVCNNFNGNLKNPGRGTLVSLQVTVQLLVIYSFHGTPAFLPLARLMLVCVPPRAALLVTNPLLAVGWLLHHAARDHHPASWAVRESK